MIRVPAVVRSKRASEPAAQAATPVRGSLLVFQVADQAYGLPLSRVQEVLPLPLLSRPPTMPNILAGFLNLAGIAVPVLRLDRLLGLPDLAPTSYTPLVILRLPEARLALMVEKVNRIVAMAGQTVLAVREDHSFNDCVDGLVVIDGHAVLLLSPERLLLEKEHQCLAELQDREQARLQGLEEAAP